MKLKNIHASLYYNQFIILSNSEKFDHKCKWIKFLVLLLEVTRTDVFFFEVSMFLSYRFYEEAKFDITAING